MLILSFLFKCDLVYRRMASRDTGVLNTILTIPPTTQTPFWIARLRIRYRNDFEHTCMPPSSQVIIKQMVRTPWFRRIVSWIWSCEDVEMKSILLSGPLFRHEFHTSRVIKVASVVVTKEWRWLVLYTVSWAVSNITIFPTLVWVRRIAPDTFFSIWISAIIFFLSVVPVPMGNLVCPSLTCSATFCFWNFSLIVFTPWAVKFLTI